MKTELSTRSEDTETENCTEGDIDLDTNLEVVLAGKDTITEEIQGEEIQGEGIQGEGIPEGVQGEKEV